MIYLGPLNTDRIEFRRGSNFSILFFRKKYTKTQICRFERVQVPQIYDTLTKLMRLLKSTSKMSSRDRFFVELQKYSWRNAHICTRSKQHLAQPPGWQRTVCHHLPISLYSQHSLKNTFRKSTFFSAASQQSP